MFNGLFDAASYMDLRRLPELFCGFQRSRERGPTLYPVACSPQAWAAGTPFMLLQASLGLEFNPDQNEILFCVRHSFRRFSTRSRYADCGSVSRVSILSCGGTGQMSAPAPAQRGTDQGRGRVLIGLSLCAIVSPQRPAFQA